MNNDTATMTVNLTRYEIQILIDCVNEDVSRAGMTQSLRKILDKLTTAANPNP